MDKNVSIVKVDKRHYRTIARENWGLTREQMKGKHVHHRIKRSEGGTDDPANLYVCSPSFHRWVWHDGEEFVEWANTGAQKAHEQRDIDGKSVNAVKGGKTACAEKDENGKSKHAVSMGKQGGNIRAEIMHQEKNEEGKSIFAVQGGKRVHGEKDELGRSLHNVKLNLEKNEKGKSLIAVKGGKIGGKRVHEEKDELGRSLHNVRLNEEKNKEGKSINGVKGAAKMLEEKNDDGKSINATKGGKNSARQLWQSTIDGFVSNAGVVSRHNKSRGWDPNARVKIGVKPDK